MSRRPRGSGRQRQGDAVRHGALRVVAGEHRGRRLDTPDGGTSRPTGDRIRESVFNALDSLGAVMGATVLDAFAGSGALGIEALSRGAEHVTFADTSAVAVRVVADNLTALGLDRRATVRRTDGVTAVTSGTFDLALLDPPYGWSRWDDLLDTTADHLRPGGIVVIESDDDVPTPPNLDVLRTRRYGGTVVSFLTHPGAPE